MTLWNVQKLDIVAIRKILELKSDEENLDKLIRAVLGFIQKYNADAINPAFFQDLTITPDLVCSFDDIDKILIYLIDHQIVEVSDFKDLIWKHAKITDLCRWCKAGLLDSNEFILYYLENSGDLAISLFLRNNLPNVDQEAFLSRLVELLSYDKFHNSWKNLLSIISEIPYTPYHEKIAEFLVNNFDEEVVKLTQERILISTLDYHLGLPNIIEILPQRPDLVSMWRKYEDMCAKDLIYPTKDVFNLREKILDLRRNVAAFVEEGKIHSHFALFDSLLPFGECVYSLINSWAQAQNIVAFDIYSTYLLNPNKNYESFGCKLDSQYEEVRSVQGVVRERMKPNNFLEESN